MGKFVVNRDTDRDNATDFDRAMAHENIYVGDDHLAARSKLVDAMNREANDLIDTRSARALRRAADILESRIKAIGLNPDTNKDWDQASISTAGIRWSITWVKGN